MTDNREAFLGRAIAKCIKHGVTLNLVNKDRIKTKDGCECNGFFDYEPVPTFELAVGKPEDTWFPIFIHELCHFSQWVDKDPTFMNLYAENGGKGSVEGDLDLWLGGKDFPMEDVKRWTETTKICEENCETRVYVILGKLDLDIEADDYMARALSYTTFYDTLPITRKWYINPPYENHMICKYMKDYYVHGNPSVNGKIFKGYLELIKRYCI